MVSADTAGGSVKCCLCVRVNVRHRPYWEMYRRSFVSFFVVLEGVVMVMEVEVDLVGYGTASGCDAERIHGYVHHHRGATCTSLVLTLVV